MKQGRLNHIGVSGAKAAPIEVSKKEPLMYVQKLSLNASIIVALFVASAGSAAPPKKAPNKGTSASIPKAGGKVIPLINVQEKPSKSTEEAYALVFNANISATKTVQFEGSDFEMRGVNLSPLRNGVWALFSVANGEACGPCSGMNAVHYLNADEGGWTLKSEHLDVGVAAVMGKPARQWAVTPLLGANPVLITRAGGLWQGYSCEVVNLTELAPSGPVDRGTLPISYSNGGGAKDGEKIVDLDGMIVSGNAGKNFFIRFSGSSKFTQRYQMTNGKYELVGKSQLPVC
jgi:hypothetical protein